MYRNNLTSAQIKSLYTPNAPVVALRARLAAMQVSDAAASMTDAVSELVSVTSGRRLRYVSGKLCDVR